jgi:CubicO group peptidase (beta-lactamase class C family)
MRFQNLFLIVTALLSGGAHAADLVPGAKKKLDAYFDSLQSQGQVSGSIAISERGATRYERSIGFATIENGVPQPADGGTRYRIGAVTRLFTAALAFQLAERATITLDNKLAEFYPELPNAIGISYRQLLQQRSGLADYTAAPGFDAARNKAHTQAEMLQPIIALGSKFPAGERVEISDTNYLLLGYVLEKVTERSYDDILRKQITSRLGIARTYFAGTGGSTTLEAVSYAWTPDGWHAVPDDDPSVGGGASALVSNAGDLVTFTDALMAGKVVSPYNVGAMRDDDNTGFGIGLRRLQVAGATCFGERARIDAYDAFVCNFPAQRITIAWTGNAARVPIDAMLDEVARLVKIRPAR